MIIEPRRSENVEYFWFFSVIACVQTITKLVCAQAISVIGRKIACHVLAFCENADKSVAVFQVFLLSFFPQNKGSRFKKGSLL